MAAGWLVCILLSMVVSTTLLACTFDDQTDKWASERLQTIVGKDGSRNCAALYGGWAASDAAINVKAFVFANEEHELLADWLQYHVHLFGPHNVYVMDHASHSPDICKVLSLYATCGVNIYQYNGDFHSKYKALTSLMRGMKDTFLIPLDCDEFIVRSHCSPGGCDATATLSVDRAEIVDTLQALPVDGRKYKFNRGVIVKYPEAVCRASLKFADHRDPSYRRTLNDGHFSWASDLLEPTRRKTFYYSDGFIYTDQGNHFGEVMHDGGNVNDHPDVVQNPLKYFQFTNLTLLHLNIPSYYVEKMKVLRGAHAYGYTEETNCSAVTVGHHYCLGVKQFLHDDVSAHDIYVGACSTIPEETSDTRVFAEWFRKHALSIPEMVGSA